MDAGIAIDDEDVRRTLRAWIEASIPPLHGWATVEKGLALAELVYATRAESSVEIGVFGGRGTISMALGHRAAGRGVVTAIDPWEAGAALEGENSPENDEWWQKIDYEEIFQHFVGALEACGLSGQCRILRKRSHDAVTLFEDESISVLHQDGNHSEKVSCAEVQSWGPKVGPGGYWVADDTDWPTTRRAQEMLLERGFRVIEDRGAWRVYQKP